MSKRTFERIFVAAAIIGSPLLGGFSADRVDAQEAQATVDRIDYCRQEEPRATTIDKLLKFCLKAEGVPGEPVDDDFKLSSSIVKLATFRTERQTDANDIDWLSRVLPGTALTGLVLVGVLSYGRKPLKL